MDQEGSKGTLSFKSQARVLLILQESKQSETDSFLLKDPVIVLTFSERVDNEFSGQFNEVSPENLHNMKSLDKIERAYFVFPEW